MVAAPGEDQAVRGDGVLRGGVQSPQQLDFSCNMVVQDVSGIWLL